MVITKVFAGGLMCACRSLASVAIVIVCQPAALKPSSWAANVAGGTTRLRREFPAWAKGTIRWYSSIGTCRANELALPLAGAVTGMAPGTEAGLQLSTRGRLQASGGAVGGAIVGGAVAGGAVTSGVGEGLTSNT